MSALAVDTETTGLTFFDQAFGASTCDASGASWYELPAERDALSDRLEGVERLVFHNAKFDLQKLQLAGVLDRRARGIHDTECMAHLLDEHRPKRLKYLAREILGKETQAEEALLSYVRKKANGINRAVDGYSKVPRDLLVPYALEDAVYTWELYHNLWPQVQSLGLTELYGLEMQLTWSLLDMEWDGLGVDITYVDSTAKAYKGQILETEWEIEDQTGLKIFVPEKKGQKTPEGMFNPNSNPQLRAYFEGRGHKRAKYDKHALPTIDDPMARGLMKLRGVKKMHDYLAAMQTETRDGVLHPNVRQHGTKTGRMSSGEAEG